MKTKLGLLIFWILGHFCNYIVAQPPHITGIVNISTEKETIECKFKYSDLPKYTGIMLFRGIGKPTLKDENGKKLSLKKMDKLMWNNHYTFRKLDKAPSSFSVNYKYKSNIIFKAISDKKDWMGNMAFTDSSLRASWSTAWYPVLYDSGSTVFHSEFTYDIRIVCKDCKTIYLNGSMPISGTVADFKSDIPVPLLLYAGNFEYRVNGGQLFVNSPFSPDMEELINKHIRSVEKYYEEKLQIDYDSDISIVYAQPTNKKTSIYFISFPSIVALNMNKNFAVNSSSPNMLDLWFAQCLTHEIGHYYFGSLFFPNSTLLWVFLEGFTEYMTLKAYQSIFSPELYDDDIKNKIEKIKDLNVIPLSEISDKEQINFIYRYKYVPLLLTAIEMEIGEENMWKWLSVILNKDKTVQTDYNFFRETLLEAVKDESTVVKIENNYIKSVDAKQKIIDRLSDK
jgi:hypothetical protein